VLYLLELLSKHSLVIFSFLQF